MREAFVDSGAVFSTKGGVGVAHRPTDLTCSRRRGGLPRREAAVEFREGHAIREPLRDVGDPVELATRYEREGADEIVFLDISASAEERGTLLDVARRTAERLFVPLTIGGGVRSADDVGRALQSGS